LQQRLTLTRATEEIAGIAIRANLPRVPRERAPTFDLHFVDLRNAPAEIIAAIPLEPSARIRPDDPTLVTPIGKRLAAFDLEKIYGDVGRVRKFGFGEPAFGKFLFTIVAIFSFEHTHR